jgi:hypothetical protein
MRVTFYFHVGVFACRRGQWRGLAGCLPKVVLRAQEMVSKKRASSHKQDRVRSDSRMVKIETRYESIYVKSAVINHVTSRPPPNPPKTTNPPTRTTDVSAKFGQHTRQHHSVVINHPITIAPWSIDSLHSIALRTRTSVASKSYLLLQGGGKSFQVVCTFCSCS